MRVLIGVLDKLVDAGHTVVVIEHQMDVVKRADWVIDLGPEAGAAGGRVVAMGRPEDVADVEASHTGRWLRTVLRPATASAGSSVAGTTPAASPAATPAATPATGRRAASAFAASGRGSRGARS